MTLTGELFIGQTRVATDERFQAINPVTGAAPGPLCSAAGRSHVSRATALAHVAAPAFAALSPADRAAFLESIADNIVGLGDELPDRTHLAGVLALTLSDGASRMAIDGTVIEVDEDREYRQLYRHFAELVAAGRSDIDLAPSALCRKLFCRGGAW